MPYCDCGAHVSEDFWRVFAIDGELYSCLSCEVFREMNKTEMVAKHLEANDTAV